MRLMHHIHADSQLCQSNPIQSNNPKCSISRDGRPCNGLLKVKKDGTDLAAARLYCTSLSWQIPPEPASKKKRPGCEHVGAKHHTGIQRPGGPILTEDCNIGERSSSSHAHGYSSELVYRRLSSSYPQNRDVPSPYIIRCQDGEREREGIIN
jgi:hypothetical protein